MTPRRGMPRAAPLLALAALLAAVLPPAEAGQHAVRIEYTLDATDPALLAKGEVQVTWRASGFQGRISAFCIQVDGHEYAIDLGSFGPPSTGSPQAADGRWLYHPPPGDVDAPRGKPACHAGFRALVSGLDTVQATFRLDVRRAAFSACGCEYNSYLGPEWGVVKAEALAIPFSYAFFEPQPVFQASVRLLVPPGWSTEAPWTRTAAANVYDIPGTGPPLPRGFFVLGRFAPEPHVAEAVGKEFVYVRLAQELKDRQTLFDYLERATPYYQGVYGNATGQRILVVSAGPPMFTGGLGSTDSLFVHQNSSQETIAHEYAHVWQRFQTVDRAGESSLWVNEGDADLHGALSRFVTEIEPGFDMARLNREFREEHERFSADPDYRRPLAAATYGCPEEQPCNEQVAYKKGLATVVYLDQEMRRITLEAAGFNDVLRILNDEFERNISQRASERRVTNADVLAAVNKAVQRHASVDMRNFFDLFVQGPDWPPYRELAPEVPITFDRLALEPAEPVAGANVTVRVLATNVRASAEAREVQVLVDEAVVRRQNVTVPGGGSLPLTFVVPAGEPGTHTVRVAYLRQDFRTLAPARLSIAAMQPLSPPREGTPFDLAVDLRNDGEAAARAEVDVVVAGQRRTASVEVPGRGEARATLPFLVLQNGTVEVEVAVRWAGAPLVASGTLDVGLRDRDGDGVPDALDAYPDDAQLSEASPINDIRKRVPAPALGGLALALLLAWGLAGRRA